MYHIDSVGKDVLIVSYGCYVNGGTEPVISDEHKEIGLFTEDHIPGLRMPDGYKRSVMDWYARLRSSDRG